MQNKGTTTRQMAVTLSPANEDGKRSLRLINAFPGETLTGAQRTHQANSFIAGVRRFLAHRPEFELIGDEKSLALFARETSGFGNAWVRPSVAKFVA